MYVFSVKFVDMERKYYMYRRELYVSILSKSCLYGT